MSQATTPDGHYYEDITPRTIERFGAYKVTRAEVIEFAAKYDPQPFHLSDEAAAATHFGRLAASGWHTCAMTMAMVVANMKAKRHVGYGAPGIEDLRWLIPVYPGDTLRCECEILSKRRSASRPEIGLFRMATSVFNQHDQPVMRFTSTGMAAVRDPAAP